ncbi:uncharacterized protein G2W53_008058 [Senna tora]|uniref:Uncharacterized protein n=1 Tax=Senna tora TaxID=362788 RepID=A0A835CEA9_9FABA|nr:uncharacterized protein G2W53_008058 [Senna tora]
MGDQDVSRYHHQHLGPIIVMHSKKDKRRNCRLWSSFIQRGINQFDPIVGKVTAHSDHWEDTFLKGCVILFKYFTTKVSLQSLSVLRIRSLSTS